MSEGLDGLLDFVGYPVGEMVVLPLPPVAGAFLGLLDFVGYPVGQGVGGAVRRGNTWVAGIRNALAAMMEQERARRVMEALAQRVMGRLLARRLEYDADLFHQKMITARAVWTVALTEL